VVAADADAVTWAENRSALAHDDLAASYGLPSKNLDAKPLRL
jgi:hypothetical protein